MQIDLKKGKLLELVWKEPKSPKQLNCLVSRELPYQGPARNSRSTEKPPATGVISAELTDRDRRAIERIVGSKHRATAAKVTAGLNQHLNCPVSPKTSP